MTEKEIENKTNIELSYLLEDIGMTNNFEDSSDTIVIYEAARRLRIERRVPFNYEQFNV